MKTGIPWYRRSPVAFLGDVQGMKACEIAVYAIVLDLIYKHGRGIHNDPKWIADWMSDMGAAAVRKTLSTLIERGKLVVTSDGFLTNKDAENELETQRKLKEKREKAGHIGGVSSGNLGQM